MNQRETNLEAEAVVTKPSKTSNKKRIAMIAGNAVTMCIAVAVSVIALGGNSGRTDGQDVNLIELSLVNNNISDYSPVSFVPNLNY